MIVVVGGRLAATAAAWAIRAGGRGHEIMGDRDGSPQWTPRVKQCMGFREFSPPEAGDLMQASYMTNFRRKESRIFELSILYGKFV